MTRFADAWERHKTGRLTAEEAGEMLGISARLFRRLHVRYAAADADGLRERRPGHVLGQQALQSELAQVRWLYREEYADFMVMHFHEELRRRHNYALGYMVTRPALRSTGMVTKQSGAAAPQEVGNGPTLSARRQMPSRSSWRYDAN